MIDFLDALPWWGFALLSAFFAARTTIFAQPGVGEVDSNLAGTLLFIPQ